MQQINAVREIAPHVPEAWIRQDLARTGSTNATVERIFERFPPPPEPNEEEGEARNIPVVDDSPPLAVTPDSIDETIENVTEEVQKLEKRTPTGFRHSSEERENLLRDRKELMKQKGRLFVFDFPFSYTNYMNQSISQKARRTSAILAYACSWSRPY